MIEIVVVVLCYIAGAAVVYGLLDEAEAPIITKEVVAVFWPVGLPLLGILSAVVVLCLCLWERLK